VTSVPGISRRRLFGAAGAAVAAGGVGGYALYAAASENGKPAPDDAAAVDFYGPHQAGIVTPAQDRLHFATFDLMPGATRDSLIQLLKDWTGAAAKMTAGHDVGEFGAVSGPVDAPPDDTGEALGLPPSQLTLTVGFGPGLFTDTRGRDRFKLTGRRPPALIDLPPFVGDELVPERCGGDLAVQACADDPQVAVHAIRNMARMASSTATVRYSQLGFGRTSSTSRAQTTPRNMMGFKDGTRNLKLEDTAKLDQQLWVQPGDGPDWMIGGSYLVARRIRMTIETWDRTSLAEQEAIIGRHKGSGAPLGKADEFDEPDFTAKDAKGQPRFTPAAHIRMANPSANKGAELLRRGYNFVDGTDGLGRLDAGLFFLAYQRDPRKQFVQVQRNLSKDSLNEYIRHVGSGIFACPPGVHQGTFWGEPLFT
jgi:deferrochelatase/peroxidase EfeB